MSQLFAINAIVNNTAALTTRGNREHLPWSVPDWNRSCPPVGRCWTGSKGCADGGWAASGTSGASPAQSEASSVAVPSSSPSPERTPPWSDPSAGPAGNGILSPPPDSTHPSSRLRFPSPSRWCSSAPISKSRRTGNWPLWVAPEPWPRTPAVLQLRMKWSRTTGLQQRRGDVPN